MRSSVSIFVLFIVNSRFVISGLRFACVTRPRDELHVDLSFRQAVRCVEKDA